MLVTNPRRINHEQLRILARNAKGGIAIIICIQTTVILNRLSSRKLMQQSVMDMVLQ